MQLILASKSPRRHELLTQLGIEFKLVDTDIDETPKAGENPQDMVLRLAIAKAQAGRLASPHSSVPVLGADTCVVMDKQILGKPKSLQDGLNMLQCLSGACHEVLTAVAISTDKMTESIISQSKVYFREITDAEAISYWNTGEPQDKAGAYAIQGLGGIFVKHLEGSFTGVMGLPIYETAQLLQKANIKLLTEGPR